MPILMLPKPTCSLGQRELPAVGFAFKPQLQVVPAKSLSFEAAGQWMCGNENPRPEERGFGADLGCELLDGFQKPV